MSDKTVDDLRAALALAMSQWRDWVDEARGADPWECMDHGHWALCVDALGYDPAKIEGWRVKPKA